LKKISDSTSPSLRKERDKRASITPPPDVAEQIAPDGPFPQRAESDSEAEFESDEDTPTHLPIIQDEDTASHDISSVALSDKKTRDRIKATSKQVIETSKVAIATQQIAEDTSDQVDKTVTGITTLRLEMKEHLVAQDGTISELKSDMGQVKGQVGVLAAHMDHVRSTTDKILPTLLEQLTKDRDAVRNEDVIVRTASVEVHKHQEIAATEIKKSQELATIKDAEDRAAYERKRTLKIWSIAGTIFAGALALIELLLHG
jgi:hypothetical protein